MSNILKVALRKPDASKKWNFNDIIYLLFIFSILYFIQFMNSA